MNRNDEQLLGHCSFADFMQQANADQVAKLSEATIKLVQTQLVLVTHTTWAASRLPLYAQVRVAQQSRPTITSTTNQDRMSLQNTCLWVQHVVRRLWKRQGPLRK